MFLGICDSGAACITSMVRVLADGTAEEEEGNSVMGVKGDVGWPKQ